MIFTIHCGSHPPTSKMYNYFKVTAHRQLFYYMLLQKVHLYITHSVKHDFPFKLSDYSQVISLFSVLIFISHMKSKAIIVDVLQLNNVNIIRYVKRNQLSQCQNLFKNFKIQFKELNKPLGYSFH